MVTQDMDNFPFTDADLDVCKCSGSGWLPAGWAFGRPDECTCGAGNDDLAFHALDCDAVPCPFCPLEAQ